MRVLDDPTNRETVNEDAKALRKLAASWRVERPFTERPYTQNSPLLLEPTIDILEHGFRELITGFDDAEDKWGSNYKKNIMRRDVRKAIPALQLQDELANCPQVRDYVDGLVRDKVIEADGRDEHARFVAHNLMGSVIIRAIMTAQIIGIKIPRVEPTLF